MQAGKLRWPIVIEQKTAVKNTSTGEVTYTWGTFASTRASMSFVARPSSRGAWEGLIAQQLRAVRIVQFDIRYIAGIDEQKRVRVLDDGKIYDIKMLIDPDNRHRELWLICEFGLSTG
jgi:SPP1 family predicted phage head-tail adaptor